MRTAIQTIALANELAREFCLLGGFKVPPDFKFYEDSNPRGMVEWERVVTAFALIEGTDLHDVMIEMEEEAEEIAEIETAAGAFESELFPAPQLRKKQ